MNNQYQQIGLYDHNITSYEKITEAFQEQDIAAIVHATGTGKSYNALQLAYDNKNKKITYVVPSKGIIEHIKRIINNNPNLNFERDFPNLEFRTYQSFINLNQDEIKNLDIDILILDEFHHIGAPIWGQRINQLIETHPETKIFGMTAYTVRDRGTSYERDMTNPDTNELFSNKVVSRYDLCDAMIDGVLPKPIYKSAYVNLIGTEMLLEEKVRALDATTKEYQEYMTILTNIKKRIHEAPSMSDVIKRNIKPNGKYIYFCPPSSEEGVNDINTIKEEARKWFLEMGLQEENIVLYSTTSDMGINGKHNREAFYNDIDANGKSTDGKLRVMFAINQYNEGIHAPNVDGVIMGRGTTSDIVYFEQLGRALSVRGQTKEKFDEYEKYSYEELLELSKKRDIPIKENTSKEERIEKLLAPIIIDLTNNFEFIKELENNLKDRIKSIQVKGPGEKRIIKIRDASFDIEIANEELFNMLKSLSERLTMTWEDYYNLAKLYYEHHGNLEVPVSFITANGYEPDENGDVKLGKWIVRQRYNTPRESEHGRLLSQIGMRFEIRNNEEEWEKMYEYAKIYYEHHSNLEVPTRFITTNGYEPDENGDIKLGRWISVQRYRTPKESERGILLSQIGMRFETRNNEEEWEKMYEYAKIYYEHHSNLEVPTRFITTNGYEPDENGDIKLGRWISVQRYRTPKESERGILLSQIGMRFETRNNEEEWEKMYEYAKIYYEHHSNLEVPTRFITTNGYEADENGDIKLGQWISLQRYNTPKESEYGRLLSQIGMRFETRNNEEEWKKKYKYAKIYYEHHGNLEVPQHFITTNGYEADENGNIRLGRWIHKQKEKTSKESERGILLSQIGMIWNIKDNQEQIEAICNEDNIDLNINKKVLKHISIQELISKISFLEENKIPITDERRKLHEIFSMSSIVMKATYNITLEELITKYYISNKERGGR